MTGTSSGTAASRVFVMVSICAALATAPVSADLLLHYDFNDDSDPETVRDISGNDNDAEVLGAMYTEAGMGRTGADDDLAMDFLAAGDASHINVLTAMDGAFDTIAENDAATIAMWVFGGASQPVNNSVFWFYAEGATGSGRGLQAHLPWGNRNIYFDVAGCCNADQRINAPTEDIFFKGRWNHYAFVKDGGQTRIYQNGVLFLESAPDVIAPLDVFQFTNVDFGSATDGGNSYNGLIDDIMVWDEALAEEDIEELAAGDVGEVLTVDPTSLRMREGDSRQLTVTLFGSDGVESDVTAGAEGTTYSSDPAGIVSISEDGRVTAIAVGETTITVTNGDLELTVAVIVDEALPEAELILFYDFNDPSDPEVVRDTSGNDNDAEVLGPAEYTLGCEGRTGEDGDYAMDMKDAGDGSYINVVTAFDGAFETINENDAATVALWIRGGSAQPVNDTMFRFSGDFTDRILGSHIPWSNSNVYFDVGGCCATGTPAQRINAGTDPVNFKDRWNHYAFVKDGTRTAIYQNGELFLESGPNAEMISIAEMSINAVVFGSSVGGAESYHGLIDDVGVWDGPLSEDEIRELADMDLETLLVQPRRITMRMGDERQFTVNHIADDGLYTDVTPGAEGTTYSVEPADIVSISADGLIVGEAEGEVVVTVTNGDLKACAKVTVLPPPLIVKDLSGNDNDAQVLGLAKYTEDGGGRTGEEGDFAMDFGVPGDGSHLNVTTALDGAFDSINENDAVTIAMWCFGGEAQPVNNSVFWFYSETASGSGRGLQAHLPWSNSNIYFDVAGCCDAITQRINAPTIEEFFKGEWNHYAFVKDGTATAIYQNGELFLESAPDAQMGNLADYPFSNIVFGSATGGGNSYNGLLDDIIVYDGALSGDEIVEVMEDGPLAEDPPAAELLLYYSFNAETDLGPRFVRGDANADGAYNISDGSFILNALFAGGTDPTCQDAADANTDGSVNIADGVYVLNSLFGGGGQPGAPFPDCGTAEILVSCEAFAACE